MANAAFKPTSSSGQWPPAACCRCRQEYLSQRQCVHRDLAARNVLLGAGRVAKLCDFGLARDMGSDGGYQKRSNSKLPLKWMALEALRGAAHTTHSDVWSYGVLLWEIVTMGRAARERMRAHARTRTRTHARSFVNCSCVNVPLPAAAVCLHAFTVADYSRSVKPGDFSVKPLFISFWIVE